MEGIRRPLVLGLVLIAGTAIDQAPSIGPLLLQYSSLTPLERECYEGEVQPYRKTDYKLMIYIGDICCVGRHISFFAQQQNIHLS